MKMRTMRVGMVVLVVVVVVMGVVGVAGAQGPDGRPGVRSPRERIAGAVVQAAADAAGMTRLELIAELRAGVSVNDVLEAAGVDPQTVIDDVIALVTDEVNQAVTDGKITQERADSLLEICPRSWLRP